MKREGATTLKARLDSFLLDNPLFREGLLCGRVLIAWNKIVGERIQNATLNLHFANGILYCTLSSSVLRGVLLQRRQYLMHSLAKEVGEGIVIKIVIR